MQKGGLEELLIFYYENINSMLTNKLYIQSVQCHVSLIRKLQVTVAYLDFIADKSCFIYNGFY
jgi:hypothetical protein